jgi:tRNA (cmo5U34)-methyltransferase
MTTPHDTTLSGQADPGRSRNDFDMVAPIYDALATLVFAGAIRRAQVSLLHRLRGLDRGLILGGGTGWFLLELLERTDIKRVLYVEMSPKMLESSRQLIAQRRPEFLSRVEFRLGTEQSVTSEDGPFDLLVTNFFLDLFSDQNCAQMIERLHPNLAKDGRWLFVDFHTPEGGWQRVAAVGLFKVMFTFFNVTSKMESKRPPHYQGTFDRLGVRTDVEEHFYGSMIRAKLLVNA